MICTLRCCVQTLLFFVVLSGVTGLKDRKITGKFSPGCDACTENDTLIYIKAEGTHDTIHQIWDFTRSSPTIILMVASVNSSMVITWVDTYPVKFKSSEKPKYSFATSIEKLYEYNDIEDHGFIDAKSPRRSVPFTGCSWVQEDIVLTEDEVMLKMRAHFNNKTDIIDVKLDLLPFRDYAADLPHLIHTANSSLVEVSLVNLTTWRHYNSSRFALSLVMVSMDSSNDTMRYNMRKSLDDEHTPGVFEIVEIKSPGSEAAGAGGYLQFRPVAYTQRERNVASSTYVHVSPFNRTRIPERSTLRSFYDGAEWSSLLVQRMVVSFGEPGDGFYAHHNFTGWSMSVGYGSPPLESFSALVTGLVALGLGLPVVLALSGALYGLSRRCRRRHERLIDQ